MRTLTILLAAAALAGCAAKPSALDAGFGSSVMKARAAQTIDPAAAAKAKPAAGIDGAAAVAAVDSYRKSFETPPAPVNVFNIGIGNSAGATTPAR